MQSEGEAEADAQVEAIARDWRTAALAPVDAALCVFAEQLTLAPATMGRAEVESLRAAGLGDRAIHDAVQVVGYFNYINRIADALGVELETFVRAWGEAGTD
ncbi:MAG TPA: hypothetical protein VFZ65_19870 [Planctomycetota bacterium]|nr:hypothetical protein [Planctomycetota bacterium]